MAGEAEAAATAEPPRFIRGAKAVDAATAADEDVAATRGVERWLSIVVPCRNERAHVDAFVADALAQQAALPPPWRLELLIADGASDDGSAERLHGLAATEPRLRVLANPARTVSAGLNRALAAARGEVLLRMDVHTRYAPDYAAQCLAALARTGADAVGGPWRAECQGAGVGAGEGQGAWGCAIAAAFQLRWGAGGARSRDLGWEGEVDTVYLGCWPRATFERFGGFDEALVRNQDDEHNLRIRLGGGRVWQSAAIRSTYRPRSSWAALARQWLQYGYWRAFVMHKHGRAAALRHRLPAAYLVALALALPAAAAGVPAPLVLLAGSYALWALALGLAAPAPGLRWQQRWRVPLVLGTMPLAYGAGTLAGHWDLWRHGRPRDAMARLTR